MEQRFKVHPSKLIETAFRPEDLRLSESLFSLGNGHFGLRGSFEEDYSGDSHRGCYLAGVWFPDRTRVGWWKNGYPEYFGKMVNALNPIGTHIRVNGILLDAGLLPVEGFSRELDLFRGVLSRTLRLRTPEGGVTLRAERFVSMADRSLLGGRLSVTPDYPARVEITVFLDTRVRNEDSNYGEEFWQPEGQGAAGEGPVAWVSSRTRENPFGTPRFALAAALACRTEMALYESGSEEGRARLCYAGTVRAGESAALDRHVCVLSDRDHPREGLAEAVRVRAAASAGAGYDAALRRHERAWQEKWEGADLQVEGDDRVQQGLRFCMFHLLSTYTGDDGRLNIGPKGFTGEKYGGATYWDTEAFCFPVYLATAGEEVARQLLKYRYRQLDGARLNARRQGLPGALFPMVTFDGVECHNEWEITFMEIHRNAAVAHAIFEYTAWTGDTSWQSGEGLQVLLEIARFFAGRVHRCGEYFMIHGVTGPNEYENNVCNNWYTNRMAAWCLEYFCEAAQAAGEERQAALGTGPEELARFREIAGEMYLPRCPDRGIFVQHDTFLDKELLPASSIPEKERPICRHWSWDRILRSCFIKQADVLQGLYFLGHLYKEEDKRSNFDFYEPMTVHESSLSPGVHAVLAAELGYERKALELLSQNARQDLDNLNRDSGDGLHITGMAGAWLGLVRGFAGMRTVGGLSFAPRLPEGWVSYGFRVLYRGRAVRLRMDDTQVRLTLEEGEPLDINVYGNRHRLDRELICGRKKT